jgi:hypothetical protein
MESLTQNPRLKSPLACSTPFRRIIWRISSEELLGLETGLLATGAWFPRCVDSWVLFKTWKIRSNGSQYAARYNLALLPRQVLCGRFHVKAIWRQNIKMSLRRRMRAKETTVATKRRGEVAETPASPGVPVGRLWNSPLPPDAQFIAHSRVKAIPVTGRGDRNICLLLVLISVRG